MKKATVKTILAVIGGIWLALFVVGIVMAFVASKVTDKAKDAGATAAAVTLVALGALLAWGSPTVLSSLG